MPDYPENKAIDNWLAQETPEPVLEPDRPIIDPHHHLWDHRTVDPGMGFEQKLYLCEELTNDIKGQRPQRSADGVCPVRRFLSRGRSGRDALRR